MVTPALLQALKWIGFATAGVTVILGGSFLLARFMNQPAILCLRGKHEWKKYNIPALGQALYGRPDQVFIACARKGCEVLKEPLKIFGYQAW